MKGSFFICFLLLAGQAYAKDIFRAPKSGDVPTLIKTFFLKDKSDSGPFYLVQPIHRSAVRAIAKVGAPAVPDLVRALANKDFAVNRYATEALALIGKPAVAPLVAALGSRDEDERQRAADALSWIGEPAVPALIKTLQQRSPKTRYWAACAFHGLSAGSRRAEMINALAAATKDSDADVRAQVIIVLGEMLAKEKRAIAALADVVVEDKDSHNRFLAASALAEIGPAAKAAVPTLIRALRSSHKDVRSSAVIVLGKIGPASEPATAALLETLKDKDRHVRAIVAEALGRIGSVSKPVMAALQEALKDKAGDVRVNAAFALGRIGPRAKDAVPSLIEVIKDDRFINRDHRYASIKALGRIGPAAKAAIPTLIKLRQGKEPEAVKATLALCTVAAEKKHLPLLIEILTEKKYRHLDEIHETIASTLHKIGQPAVPKLITSLSQKGDKDRWVVVGLLATIGKPAVPALIAALQGKQLRLGAVEALLEIGPDAKAAMPVLTAAMKSDDADFRHYVLDAITTIDWKSSKDILVAAFKDESAVLRHYAAYDFVHLWGDDEELIVSKILPMATRDLAHADEEVRWNAARTLGWVSLHVGPKSFPAVLAALDHKDAGVRQSLLIEFDSYYLNHLRLNPLSPLQGPPIPALKKALQDKDAEVRRLAKHLISMTGEDDRDGNRDVPEKRDVPERAVPNILKILHDPRKPAWDRVEAALDLQRIDSRRAAVEAVPLLVELLRDRFEESMVRWHAAEALGVLGSNTPAVISSLEKAIRNVDKVATAEKLEHWGMEDWDIWLWSNYALIKLKSPQRAKLLAEVIRVLRDRESGYSDTAAAVLGRLGPEAKTSVPALLEALKDDWPSLQWNAAEALKQIDPKAAAKAGLK